MLFTVIAVGIVAGAELVTTVAAVTPAEASQADLWVFFLSLYALLSAASTLIWYTIQRVLSKRRVTTPSFFRCLRQAMLFTGLATFTLFLNSINVFQVWDIFPLIVAGILIEFFFQAEKRPHAHLRNVPQEPQ